MCWALKTVFSLWFNSVLSGTSRGRGGFSQKPYFCIVKCRAVQTKGPKYLNRGNGRQSFLPNIHWWHLQSFPFWKTNSKPLGSMAYRKDFWRSIHMWGGQCGLSCSEPHKWGQSLSVLDVGFLCTKKADQRLEKMTLIKNKQTKKCLNVRV